MNAVCDRNLLFGIVALQLNFIDRDQLIAAMNAWAIAKDKSLGEILVEQKALSSARRDLLAPLVEEHIRQHDGDPQKSLAAIGSVDEARDALQNVRDGDVLASIARLKPADGGGADRSQASFGTVDSPPRDAVSGGEVHASLSTVGPTASGARFRILRKHAAGGLGVVFVAHDSEVNRQIALKEIKFQFASDAESRSRFIMEAEITGRLEHPGIVPVYGLGHYPDGRPFYAMRFIKGDSLSEAADAYHRMPTNDPGQRAIALRDLLRRFIDVCNAIDYAHSKGVLHRDLKPGNIMLGKYGETLVVDWGLAKAAGVRDAESKSTSGGPTGGMNASADGSFPRPFSGGSTMELDEHPIAPVSGGNVTPTQMGSAMGTPAFMPPEQAAGRLDLLSPQSDVYSLGATLYYLLVGRPPFESRDLADVLSRVQKGDFPKPRAIKSDVDPALEAICLKAMSRDIQGRYPTALELRKDLDNFLADTPVSAWTEPFTVKARRFVQRHRVIASTIAAAVVVAFAFLGVLTVVTDRANEKLAKLAEDEKAAKVAAEKANEAAELQAKLAKANERLALDNEAKTKSALVEVAKQKRTADANLTRSEWRLYASNIAAAQSAWDANNIPLMYHYLDACRWDFRGWEHDYLFTLANKNQRTFPTNEIAVTNVVFSPDGKRIIAGSAYGKATVCDAKSGDPILVVNRNAQETKTFPTRSNGRLIVSRADEKSARIWDVDTGREIVTLENIGDVYCASFSGDGKRIVFGNRDKSAKVWEVSTGKEVLSLPKIGFGNLALSSDGTRIGFSDWDDKGRMLDVMAGRPTTGLTSCVLDAKTGKPLFALGGYSNGFRLEFSPDDTRIVGAGLDGSVCIWDAKTGELISILKGHKSVVTCCSFSRDGRRIVSGGIDGAVKVWDAIAAKEISSLKGHRKSVECVSFNSEGTQIVSGGGDSTVKIWDANTSQEPLVLEPGYWGCDPFSFSRDGKFVIGGAGFDVGIWDAATGKKLQLLRGHTVFVKDASFSFDGKRIVSGSQDGIVKIWDAITGLETRTLKVHDDSVDGVDFNADGTRIVTCNWRATKAKPGAPKVWDANSGLEKSTLKVKNTLITSVSFSRNDNRIVGAGLDGRVRIWDSTTGETLHEFKGGHGGGVTMAKFSRDGKRIVSGGQDKVAIVWDAESGQKLVTLKGHTESIYDASFNSDATRIVTTSFDQTTKIWDSASGQELLTFKGQWSKDYRAAFSEDGKRIVSSVGEPRIWDATMKQPFEFRFMFSGY